MFLAIHDSVLLLVSSTSCFSTYLLHTAPRSCIFLLKQILLLLLIVITRGEPSMRVLLDGQGTALKASHCVDWLSNTWLGQWALIIKLLVHLKIHGNNSGKQCDLSVVFITIALLFYCRLMIGGAITYGFLLPYPFPVGRCPLTPVRRHCNS